MEKLILHSMQHKGESKKTKQTNKNQNRDAEDKDIIKQLSICLEQLFSQDFRGRKKRIDRQHLKGFLKMSYD